MFRNYFKIAWRNLMKSKVFSFINIFGLAVGLTCCMLISLYLYNEMSYDKYHPHVDQLYQLGTTFTKQGKGGERTANSPAPMAAAMKNEYPEISETARILVLFAEDKTLIQYNAGSDIKSFYETKGYLADASFFKLFRYHFIEGDPATALVNPNTVVLNEEIAKKIFGDRPALNQTIKISSNTNGDTSFTVTGVFRPMDKPTQIDARFFMSIRGGRMEQFITQQTDMVGNNMFQTFFLLKPGADAKKLEAKFPAFVQKYMGKGLTAAGFYKQQFLIPVRDMHLKAGMAVDISPVGSMTYLYILGSIAIFTLLIACINFMNLSTARSSKRSAEVGIRKVLGAEKHALIKQFLGESVMMSIIAFFIALGLTRFLLPEFARLSGRNISTDLFEQGTIIGAFFILSILTGVLAGSYPAFYLSSFKPVKVLKGKLSNSLSAITIRKGLVVFQFVISVALIIASVIISNQMKFMRSKDLGFAKDQQIIIPLRSSTAKNIYASFKNDIKNNPEVVQTGATMYYPGIMNPSDMGLRQEGMPPEEAKLVHTNWVDENFLQTLDIRPLAGRIFSPEFPADTDNRIIINQEAVKQIGFKTPQDALGQKVYFDWRGKAFNYTIIGVIKDFHFQDLHVPIAPYAFFLNSEPYYNYIMVHSKTANVSPLLKSLAASWNKYNPAEPFEYSFLDDDFQRNYEAENRLASMVSAFTLIAILISCLGLFGLATFSAEQRTKEIGIRKVLGASVANVVGLLSKDFLVLVGIAVVVAIPIAWYAMSKWLEDFAYRVSIGWWMFLIAALLAMLIAFITISFQAIRAANSNPVKNLRSE
jgi:putative ABC transport system permease protein